MKKEIINLIFDVSKPFFDKYGFKLKKNPEGGVIYSFTTKHFEFGGMFSFSKIFKGINYIGMSSFHLKIYALEEIYTKILNKNELTPSNRSSVFNSDLDWSEQILKNGRKSENRIPADDFAAIENHTLKILNRIEIYMLPLAEQYLSLPYWADLYEKKKETLCEENQADLFYNYIQDRYMVKHLIILKLCGSPSFEEAYKIRLSQILKLIEQSTEKESESFKRLLTIKNVILDLKEHLDATPPKYDLHDLTPPYRFERKEVVEVDNPPVRPKVLLKGRSLEVDVNVFDITPAQKEAVYAFLENIEGHYDTVLEEIISNAEYENQDGGDFSTDCGGTLACIAEESGLIKTKPVDFEREAAEYLYPQYISIDVEHDNAVISIANNYCDLVLNAHLTLAGHVEIVAWE